MSAFSPKTFSPFLKSSLRLYLFCRNVSNCILLILCVFFIFTRSRKELCTSSTRMVIQNLYISHDCKGRLDPTPFPITRKELVENYTFPEFTPYGTNTHTRFIFFVTEILFITAIVIGNLMIVFTIWIKSHLRTPGFMYIVSVAISHFLIGVVVIPMYIIGHIPHQHLTTFQCKLVEYISCVASAASPYSAVALATHRFREKLIITSQEITYKQVVVDSCIVWGLSLLYAIKAIVMYDTVTEIVLGRRQRALRQYVRSTTFFSSSLKLVLDI